MVDHLIIKSDGTYTNNLYGHEYYESPEHHYITSNENYFNKSGKVI